MYKKTKKNLISQMYGSQRGSSKTRGHDMPTYSKKEFSEWLNSQTLFHRLFDDWKRLEYSKEYIPSVDRIDPALGYTVANIQLMTWEQNMTKGRRECTGPKKPVTRPVIQYTEAGEFVAEYASMKIASTYVNTSEESISKACKRKVKLAGGYQWDFS